jgi:hypothetical protein
LQPKDEIIAVSQEFIDTVGWFSHIFPQFLQKNYSPTPERLGKKRMK